MFRVIFYTLAGFIAGYFLDRYLSNRHRGSGSWHQAYPAPEPENAAPPSPPEPAVDHTLPPPPFEEAVLAEPDDLTRIKGIGPTFANRLAEAGIVTFRQLAQTAPPELERITRIRQWQQPGVAEWIEEANRFQSSD